MMRCRYCGAPTSVLETRARRSEFFVVRRLACKGPVEHRFNSVEVLETFIRKLSKGHVEKLLQLNERGAERMRLANERAQRVLALRGKGIKQEAVASMVGVSIATVRKIEAKYRIGPGMLGRPPNPKETPDVQAAQPVPAPQPGGAAPAPAGDGTS